jgi:SAM-dependent methyltransferase
MPLNVEACPLCKAEGSLIFDRREFRGMKVANRLCSNCGFVYQSPRMSEREVAAFYEGSYRQFYQDSEEPTQEDLSVQRSRAKTISAFLRNCGVESIHRYLDIGSSTGILMEKIHSDYSCEIVGVEPGSAYRAFALERGVRVYATLEEVETRGERIFDLISLLHVLEHLPDPVGYLQHLRSKYLASNGWLLIEVPNLYAHDCFEVAHLSAFSEFTLRNALAAAGYSVTRIKRHGEPRSRLIPLYLTVLAKPNGQGAGIWAEKPAREKGVTLKRRTGMLHRRILERLFPGQAWLPVDTN